VVHIKIFMRPCWRLLSRPEQANRWGNCRFRSTIRWERVSSLHRHRTQPACSDCLSAGWNGVENRRRHYIIFYRTTIAVSKKHRQ
jgi:hypothetical protein